jgi:transposase-like protein
MPNKKYTAEFKQQVVEDMRNNNLSQAETARKYEVARCQVQQWERIYLTEGVAGFRIERRGRCRLGCPPQLDKQREEDIISENQRLRAENAYLKNLQASVFTLYIML